MGNESSHQNKATTNNKKRASIDETLSTLESLGHGKTPGPIDESVLSRNNSSHNHNDALSVKHLETRGTSHSHLFPSDNPTLSTPNSHESAPLTPNSHKSSPPISPTLSFKRSKSLHKRKRSSVLVVHNGITGKYISSRICKIAAKFWQQNIETLSVSEQLEIGCSIFFGMLSTNGEMKNIMKSNLNENKKIEATSLRYLDMMGWLIRYLITDNIDLYALLTKLGVHHRSMGINIQHFNPMLQAMHETFAYYFEEKYNIGVKYAMDEIFSLAAQVMTGQKLGLSSHLMDITQQFQEDDIPFLKNLDICLKSQIGREYLYRYLAQTWCDEMAIYLQSLSKFKKCMSDKERFMVARDITKCSIHPTATFCLNLSYETRENAMHDMAALEQKFIAKEDFEISTEFFIAVEKEIYKLIMDNHWIKFVENIEILQSKSFNVD